MPNRFFDFDPEFVYNTTIRADVLNTRFYELENAFDQVEQSLGLSIGLPTGFAGNLSLEGRTLTNSLLYFNDTDDLDLYPLINLQNDVDAVAASAAAAAASESNAATSATNAAASATNAAVSETNAANSATAAAASEANAAASEANAATSETNTDTRYTEFISRWLPAAPGDPATDENGNPLQAGAAYFNTTSAEVQVYNGTTWQSIGETAMGGISLPIRYDTPYANLPTHALSQQGRFVAVNNPLLRYATNLSSAEPNFAQHGVQFEWKDSEVTARPELGQLMVNIRPEAHVVFGGDTDGYATNNPMLVMGYQAADNFFGSASTPITQIALFQGLEDNGYGLTVNTNAMFKGDSRVTGNSEVDGNLTVTGSLTVAGGSSYTTTADVDARIAAVVGTAPAALDTLGEIADALNDDANFAAATTTALSNRVRVDAAQTFTAIEQQQGRDNIGAIAASDIGNPEFDLVAHFDGAIAA